MIQRVGNTNHPCASVDRRKSVTVSAVILSIGLNINYRTDRNLIVVSMRTSEPTAGVAAHDERVVSRNSKSCCSLRKAARTAGQPVELVCPSFAAPVVRRAKRLHADHTRVKRCEIPEYIRASQLLAHKHVALWIHSVKLQHILGQIQSNSRYVHDERSFAVDVTTSPLWHKSFAA